MNVYDFDKTIYRRDSTMDFVRWCLKRKPALTFRLIPGTIAFVGYLCKQCSKTRFKEKFYGFLQGVPDVSGWVEEFWDSSQKDIMDWYPPQHQADDVVISASPEFLLLPICRRLNIRHLIASRVDPDTGFYLGENCWGPEKPRRFRIEFPDARIEEFYSDSYSDQPMADLAERSFLVKGETLTPWVLHN